jgi:superfamily II DNA or RNA helicase
MENQKQSDLQLQMVKRGLDFFKSKKRGYYNLAMRFGKCKVTIELVKKLHHKPTILLAYPDNKLKSTWMSEFEKWGYDDAEVIYVNFTSLHKYKNFGEAFDIFIIDEFHSCSEGERETAHEIMDDCKYTIALSGTVSHETKCEWDLFEIASYTTDQGIEDQILADYQITVHVVKLDSLIKTKDSKGKFKTEKQRYDAYTWVMDKLRKEGRDTMHLALARNRLSLSSLGKINYVKRLLSRLYDKRVLVFTGLAKVADQLGIPSFHSKTKTDDAFHRFQSGKENHLALAAMGKMGVTYNHLDSVILLNFTYNAEETAQILNRAIKLDYNGKIADLHIIVLNEEPELKKIKESLSMLDVKKIKYI